MKKIYIALTVVATALLVSCVKEESFNELSPIGENGVAFTIQNTSTRALESVSNVTARKGISIPMGVDSKGEPLFLEETIEDLNPSPNTKGAPAYTVNVGDLYSTMGVYADNSSFGDEADATFNVMDYYIRKVETEGKGWRYQHGYNGSPWPSDTKEKVNFYLRMPAIEEDFDYSTTGSVAFDYTSTASGVAQKDILFGYTQLSKEDHDSFLPNGAPVQMVHALTGVKFRSGADNEHETKTIITNVVFTGLKGSGHCVVTPASSSVVWSNLGAGPESYSLDFTNPDYSTEAWAEGTVTYEKGTDPKFGDSWYSAAADRNLNNDDGELTFWFIPQEITSNVKMKVTFCVKTPDTSGANGAGLITYEVDFGTLVNAGRAQNVKWDAGQLRTYTLNPKVVDVEIYDSMVGYKKSGLHVTNTGNVDEFVRIMVIGNWYGWATQADADANKEPMILVGYQNATGDEMVTPWFREDETYGSYFDSSFTGGHPAAGRTDWKRGTGSYFYYMKAIGPNVELAETNALFQDYTLPANKVPEIYIPSSSSSARTKAIGVHLVMEIVIQAIGVPTKTDGTPYTETEINNNNQIVWDAWTAAVGKQIKEKPYTN